MPWRSHHTDQNVKLLIMLEMGERENRKKKELSTKAFNPFESSLGDSAAPVSVPFVEAYAGLGSQS